MANIKEKRSNGGQKFISEKVHLTTHLKLFFILLTGAM